MPLKSGSSRAVIGANIKREEEAGKPRKQAIAIALKKAGQSNQESDMKRKSAGRKQLAEAVRKLRESMFPHLPESGRQGGSDEIRGKNKKGQLRAR